MWKHKLKNSKCCKYNSLLAILRIKKFFEFWNICQSEITSAMFPWQHHIVMIGKKKYERMESDWDWKGKEVGGVGGGGG